MIRQVDVFDKWYIVSEHNHHIFSPRYLLFPQDQYKSSVVLCNISVFATNCQDQWYKIHQQFFFYFCSCNMFKNTFVHWCLKTVMQPLITKLSQINIHICKLKDHTICSWVFLSKVWFRIYLFRQCYKLLAFGHIGESGSSIPSLGTDQEGKNHGQNL